MAASAAPPQAKVKAGSGVGSLRVQTRWLGFARGPAVAGWVCALQAAKELQWSLAGVDRQELRGGEGMVGAGVARQWILQSWHA